jgi:hypothetical protein
MRQMQSGVETGYDGVRQHLRARFWTDGKMAAPMLPDRPRLVKCPKCSTLFWIDEAKKLGEEQIWNKSRKWPNAISPAIPNETDFLAFLDGNKQPEKKDLYLRSRAWWAANDASRRSDSAVGSFSPAQEANLQVLASLMDEKDADQRITKAETLRELKRFDDCLKLLTQPFEEERHAEIAAFIRVLTQQKSWTVAEIKQDKTPKKLPPGRAEEHQSRQH